MNQIQEEIAKALVQLSEKSLITEAILAKKIRENIKLQGKQKAGLAFSDIEAAVYYIEENNSLHFALHLNSANDILIKQAEAASLFSMTQSLPFICAVLMCFYSNVLATFCRSLRICRCCGQTFSHFPHLMQSEAFPCPLPVMTLL